jgi:autotransporter passenger strand-loop-strand repeat protein
MRATLTVDNGGMLNVLSGGTISHTLDYGKVNISSGGTAIGTVVYGGQSIESGGTAIGTVVYSGGEESIESGGTAIGTVVNNSGQDNGRWHGQHFLRRHGDRHRRERHGVRDLQCLFRPDRAPLVTLTLTLIGILPHTSAVFRLGQRFRKRQKRQRAVERDRSGHSACAISERVEFYGACRRHSAAK